MSAFHMCHGQDCHNSAIFIQKKVETFHGARHTELFIIHPFYRNIWIVQVGLGCVLLRGCDIQVVDVEARGRQTTQRWWDTEEGHGQEVVTACVACSNQEHSRPNHSCRFTWHMNTCTHTVHTNIYTHTQTHTRLLIYFTELACPSTLLYHNICQC